MQNGYEDDVLRWYAFVLMIWIVERTFFLFFPLLGYLLIFSTFGRFLAVGVLIFLGQK